MLYPSKAVQQLDWVAAVKDEQFRSFRRHFRFEQDRAHGGALVPVEI